LKVAFLSQDPNVLEISRFLADTGSNSPVAMLLVLFWYVKVIIIEVVEMLLCIQWRVACKSSGKPAFFFAGHGANVSRDVQL
jgi:hypothetical protein